MNDEMRLLFTGFTAFLGALGSGLAAAAAVRWLGGSTLAALAAALLVAAFAFAVAASWEEEGEDEQEGP